MHKDQQRHRTATPPTPAPEPAVAQHSPGPREMRDHSFDVTWLYVVPPANTQRIAITQRQDGPFRRDTVGGRGHYYTYREELVAGHHWTRVTGSATGGHASFEIAYDIAERAWRTAIAKSEGSASS